MTLRRLGRLLPAFALLGAAAGLAAAGLDAAVTALADACLAPLGWARAEPPRWDWPGLRHWWLPFLTAAGGLVAALVCARFAPEALGPGLDHVIGAARGEEDPRARVAPVKLLAAAATLGTGGSGGVESPSGHVGAALGAGFARVTGMNTRAARIAPLAGAAAAMGALFGAPITAAVFVFEISRQDAQLGTEAFAPPLLAAVVAEGVFGVLRPPALPFPPQDVDFAFGTGLFGLAVLGVVVGVAARGFAWLFRRARASTRPLWLRAAIGGLAAGLVGLWAPVVLGPGYGVARIALMGDIAMASLVGLALAKALATLATTGWGGVAGVLFAPAVSIGAAVAAALAVLLGGLWPALVPEPAAFILAGMAGFTAAVSNAPLAAILFIAEVGRSVELLAPGAWVVAIAWIAGRSVATFPLAEERAS